MLQHAIKKGTLWLRTLQEKALEFMGSLSLKLANYSRPQKLYALAAILVFTFPDNLALGAIVAFSALIMECLPIVHFIWRSLIGKAIIVLIYAVIANFALANAASVVNQVTGVSSTYFTYGHNFAILLYIPTWIAAITILGLLFFQIVSISYVSIGIFLLKPLGIIKKLKISKYPRPISTMALRTFLTLVIIYYLQSLSENPFIYDAKLVQISSDSQMKVSEVANTSEPSKENEVAINEFLSEFDVEDSQASSMFLNNIVKAIATRNHTDTALIEQMVAHFIYSFDSDERTRCQLTENSRGVVLNDYEVLEITPDNSQALKYRYQVKTCISPAFPASYYAHD